MPPEDEQNHDGPPKWEWPEDVCSDVEMETDKDFLSKH